MMKTEPLTFRLKAGIRFNRKIDKEKDFISPGGYTMTMSGKSMTFDFEEYAGSIDIEHGDILEIECKNPDYNYENTAEITKEMLQSVSKITEFNVSVETTCETDLKPIELTYCAFELPYDNWDEIVLEEAVLKEYSFGTTGRTVVWESPDAKVVRVSENEYDVFAKNCRDHDGIREIEWNFVCRYANHYCRDWLGRTQSAHYNPENRSDFAYEMAVNCAKSYGTSDKASAKEKSFRICGIVYEHGPNDYEYWTGFQLSDEDESAILAILQKYDTEGCSVRGTKAEIKEDC